MRCLGTRLMHIFKVSIEVSIYSHYPVDFLQQHFPILMQCNITSYCMAQAVLMHVCYCMGTGAM